MRVGKQKIKELDILEQIKHKVGGIILSSRIKKMVRKKKVYNIADARKIGIVYEVKDEAHFDHIHLFVDFLHDQGKHVKAIGYVESKELMGFLKHTKVYTYFDRTGTKWYLEPTDPNALNFEDEEFDILIDLTERDILPVQFVIALSMARFKVGRYDKVLHDFYDMAIKVEGEKPLKYIIAQMKHYLTIINKNLNEAV